MNDNVGIGTLAPGASLEINPTVTATADATMFKSGIVYDGASAMTKMISLLTAVGQLVVMVLVAYVLLRLAGLIQKLGDKLQKD